MELSIRLKAIAEMVEAGSIVADVGTDHGYIPIYLILNGICERAVAMDINSGPLKRAEANIAKYNLQDKVMTILSNGLQNLDFDAVDTIIIAGIGGPLTIKILTEGQRKLDKVRQLILQPQSEIREVRRYLQKAGYLIIAENMIKDDGKYYTVMKAQRGIMTAYDTVDFEYGKLLLADKNPVLKEFLAKEKRSAEAILEQLKWASAENARNRTETMNKQLENIKEAIRFYEE